MTTNETYGRPLSPIIDLSSAQAFPSSESLKQVHSEKFRRHRYGRDSGHGALALEEELEIWHLGFRALTFRSGMAALEALLQFAWAKFETVAIQSEIYRKTEALVSGLQSIGHRSLTRVPMHSARDEGEAGNRPSQFIFAEFPSNPHFRLIDLNAEKFSTITTKPFIAIDATMSGLGNLTTNLTDQVDVICYSLTKFIGGHNDLIGGVLFVKESDYEELWALRSRMGNIISPLDAFLTSRSLKTFALRMKAHLSSAKIVLEYMESALLEKTISTYFYPGSGENNDQKKLVEDTLLNGGSVLSFIPSLSRHIMAERLANLRFIKIAPSFGSTDSLLEICSLMTRPDATTEDLLKSGLEPNLIRLSIGIDEPESIIQDLRNLLVTD